ncbi:MAG TPA: hypothetical protein VFU86_21735 [Terriglobales bacterium]|nr:hypothetical protein [Terriglobales bacterium]
MDTHPANESEKSRQEAAQHVAEAHNLLQSLQAELDRHPGLEEAIARLEAALNILSAKSSGLL